MVIKEKNIDNNEINKFNQLASRWWDPEGDFKPLHDINPLRIDYINKYKNLNEQKILDIGCGGGILSEAMALKGGIVTGIDMAESALNVAKIHQIESKTDVDYKLTTVENLATLEEGTYDIVTCLEMIEHVPSPKEVIESCSKLLKPGGSAFFSTINRNPKAFIYAILGAEHILKLLPIGTHEYAKFVKPSELEYWARNASLDLKDSTGLIYNPFTKNYSLGKNLDVNYLMFFKKKITQ